MKVLEPLASSRAASIPLFQEGRHSRESLEPRNIPVGVTGRDDSGRHRHGPRGCVPTPSASGWPRLMKPGWDVAALPDACDTPGQPAVTPLPSVGQHRHGTVGRNGAQDGTVPTASSGVPLTPPWAQNATKHHDFPPHSHGCPCSKHRVRALSAAHSSGLELPCAAKGLLLSRLLSSLQPGGAGYGAHPSASPRDARAGCARVRPGTGRYSWEPLPGRPAEPRSTTAPPGLHGEPATSITVGLGGGCSPGQPRCPGRARAPQRPRDPAPATLT